MPPENKPALLSFRRGYQSLQLLLAGLFFLSPLATAVVPSCPKPIYLTIDTGNMSQALHIAEVLKRQQIRVTFFLANELTTQGDYSLDDSWGEFWRARVAEGHRFGSHTYDHVYFKQGDISHQAVYARPQFGTHAGKTLRWGATELCTDLDKVKQRFYALTGSHLSPLWRAPGGYVTPNTRRWAKDCGYHHVGWTPHGFLGDELPSEKFPNTVLLQRALKHIQAGEILIMHGGIWSRREPFAEILEDLIVGLKRKGLCFALLDNQAYP